MTSKILNTQYLDKINIKNIISNSLPYSMGTKIEILDCSKSFVRHKLDWSVNDIYKLFDICEYYHFTIINRHSVSLYEYIKYSSYYHLEIALSVTYESKDYFIWVDLPSSQDILDAIGYKDENL